MKKKSVRDLSDAQVRDKRALLRVDFNVPLDDDGNITDDTRIRASLPTIELLLERGARPIILSHLGRPKGKPDPQYSLQPVAKRLEELCGHPVIFVESTDSDEAAQACARLKSGEILLLENTRFLGGEEKNDQRLSRALSELGDFFVNDASARRTEPGINGGRGRAPEAGSIGIVDGEGLGILAAPSPTRSIPSSRYWRGEFREDRCHRAAASEG
jgi:3-phosphoglycerate kinase